MLSSELLAKYDIPAPRYTSYPTVPYWDDTPSEERWIQSLHSSLEGDSSWSLYIHVPFCESLCTFCGCNTTITKNHDLEGDYVDNVIREWETYIASVPELLDKPLRQLHLGGGTPTFLSAENLKRMLDPILSKVTYDKDNFEGSLEVDPRKTNRRQLEVLAELGFNRISLGVQDFTLKVQELVNRVQSFEQTKKITDAARELSYNSVNFDLIYGLPCQGIEEMTITTKLTIELRPDRIALYSFARVPWIKPAQRKFTDEQLPVGAEKRALYEVSREMLLEAGYLEIGMDHFALPSDELSMGVEDKTLHRNFMGYTPYQTDVLLGLGVSSISESKDCFHQNEKVLNLYKEKVAGDSIPTLRGHIHTEEDLYHRKLILELMTNFELEIPEKILAPMAKRLETLIEDKLCSLKDGKLSVSELGRPFIRNICMTLDKRMLSKKPETKIFSQSL
jgi:oxygen-independent coproporphyrinogen-3 oxidase